MNYSSITFTPDSLQQQQDAIRYIPAQGIPRLELDVGLSRLSLTNSFPNVVNLTTPINIIENNNSTGYNLLLANGTYNYSDVNNALQLFQVQNNLYVRDSIGNNVTFASVQYNPNYNNVSVITTPVPVTGAFTGGYTGYTNPVNLVQSGLSPTINFGSLGQYLSLTGTYGGTGVYNNSTGSTGASLTLGRMFLTSDLCSDIGYSNSDGDGILSSFYIAPTDAAGLPILLNIDNVKFMQANGGLSNFRFRFRSQNRKMNFVPDLNSFYMELLTKNRL